MDPAGGFRGGASFTADDFEISDGQVKTVAGVNHPDQESASNVQPFEMVITAEAGGRFKSRTVRVYILNSDRTDHAWHNVCGQEPGEPPRRPRLSVADAEAHEAPGATLDFVVSLNRPAPVTMTVDYWTYPGTATRGADYLDRYGTLTFAVGEVEKTVRVPIVDDSVEDNGETVHFVLNAPEGGAAIADGKAVGIIRNSESSSIIENPSVSQPTPALSVADGSVVEGPNAKLRFEITLDRASSETVTVEASVSDGTATAGSDYRAKTLTKTFAPGETRKIAVISVLDDSLDEGGRNPHARAV